MALRRQFELLAVDQQVLEEYGLKWETIVDGSLWVLIHDFPTHPGYNHPKAVAAIRLEGGYPNVPLDMVYFCPALARRDGRKIGATEAMQMIDGKNFQRWSRHRSGANPWKVGRDNLGSHIILIEDWLEREFEKCPLT